MGLAAEAQGVYWLDDANIAIVCGELASRFPNRMSPWEHEFTKSILKWVDKRRLTWKQLRAARRLASRILLEIAKRHDRLDLLERPPTPPHLHLAPAPAPAPELAERLFDKLTDNQHGVLRVLLDGKPHRTSTTTSLRRGFVSGVSASSLERMRLVTLTRDEHGTIATITPLGREVFGSQVPGTV